MCSLTLPGAGARAQDGHSPTDTTLAALEQAAHPLRSTAPQRENGDLRPLTSMVGDATVVGFGEAAHSSHEFFTLKHRVFRHLVEHKGFRTFSLEAPWSTGLRLNEYLLYGTGDPRRIMSEDFQDTYLLWHTREYLALLRWMRAYNVAHPGDPVLFHGNDSGYAGPELYDRVTDYIRDTHPDALPAVENRYRGLRPTQASGLYMAAYLVKPLSERREMAQRTRQVVELLRQLPSGANDTAREAHTWAVRNAVAVDQVAQQYVFDFDDPADVRRAMSYRDEIMADNTLWWHRQIGDKILVSAHNGHVFRRTIDPDYPDTQGRFLRAWMGDDYIAVGLTFDHGSFNATDVGDPLVAEKVKKFTVGPAAPGTNEHLLDQVRHRDYMVDLRHVPPAAHDWLDRERASRMIGTDHPRPLNQVALRPSADILIHLNSIRAADSLFH